MIHEVVETSGAVGVVRQIMEVRVGGAGPVGEGLLRGPTGDVAWIRGNAIASQLIGTMLRVEGQIAAVGASPRRG